MGGEAKHQETPVDLRTYAYSARKNYYRLTPDPLEDVRGGRP